MLTIYWFKDWLKVYTRVSIECSQASDSWEWESFASATTAAPKLYIASPNRIIYYRHLNLAKHTLANLNLAQYNACSCCCCCCCYRFCWLKKSQSTVSSWDTPLSNDCTARFAAWSRSNSRFRLESFRWATDISSNATWDARYQDF